MSLRRLLPVLLIAAIDLCPTDPSVCLPGVLGTAAVFGQSEVTRPFYMGFSTTPAEDQGETYAQLRDHADLVSHSLVGSVPWPEALRSSDHRTYSRDLQDRWATLRRRTQAHLPHHKKYIVVSPIEPTQFRTLAGYWGAQPDLPLPAPWSGYDFNHPDVKQAYVNYLVAVVRYFRPDYLAINMEANILLARAPLRWSAFKELNEHAYTRLKRLYPGLVVFSSIQYEHMRGYSLWSRELAEQLRDTYPNVLTHEVRLLLRHSDLLGLSTFPYTVQDNRVGPRYYDVALAMARNLDLPVAIEQTGYISQDFHYPPANVVLPGSETLQNNFLGFILREAWEHRFEFVVNFVAVDYEPRPNLEDNTWTTTGLVNRLGQPKPALATWDAVLEIPFRP